MVLLSPDVANLGDGRIVAGGVLRPGQRMEYQDGVGGFGVEFAIGS